MMADSESKLVWMYPDMNIQDKPNRFSGTQRSTVYHNRKKIYIKYYTDDGEFELVYF